MTIFQTASLVFQDKSEKISLFVSDCLMCDGSSTPPISSLIGGKSVFLSGWIRFCFSVLHMKPGSFRTQEASNCKAEGVTSEQGQVFSSLIIQFFLFGDSKHFKL